MCGVPEIRERRTFCSRFLIGWIGYTKGMYYNYHGVAKRLIREGKLIAFERWESWGNISPAFVLFFKDHKPMPIREERAAEYAILIEETHALHLVGRGDPKE